ncbi:MAG: hypothetical protein GWP27_04960 [Bacteroidetes bacterium]|nr:hypothetical protein [Bacteroidota bacterium]
MVAIIAYLRLIRLPILLLIAAIQLMVRYFIIEPMLIINNYSLMMSDLDMFLLIISTVLIAAGGYAINDYFDVKIDRINKPKTVIIDRLIKRRVAMLSHVVLATLGVLVAGYLTWHLGMWKVVSLFVFVSAALWYYSTNLKNQPFFGNFVIAVLAGFVALIVGILEISLQNNAHPEIIEELGYSIFNIPAYWTIGLASALFLLTLVREVTKDVIDIRGDRTVGANTIPIALGVKNTKSILITIYVVFGTLYSWVYFEYLNVHIGMTTVFFAINLLLVLQIILIVRARTKKHFLHSANLNNLVTLMVLGCTFLLKISIETHFL